MKYSAIVPCILSICIPLAVCAQTGGASNASKNEARSLHFVSSFDAMPFAFRESGRGMGFEVDLGNEIGRRLGAKVHWTRKSFSIATFLSMLQSEQADAVISSISVTPDREGQFLFSEPYYRTNLCVATQKDVDWRHQDFVNGLKGLSVGVLKGTTSEEWARRNLRSAHRIKYYSIDRMEQDLKTEKIFCILLDEDILNYTLAKHYYRFQIVERGLDHEYYAIAFDRGNSSLCSEINAALSAIDADGTYLKIYEKWFKRRVKLPKKAIWH